jgi:hypothetical protein
VEGPVVPLVKKIELTSARDGSARERKVARLRREEFL